MVDPGPGVRYFSDEVHAQAWPAVFGRPGARRIILLVITVGILGIDYLTGPTIRFPAFFAPPILLAAWYDGFLWGSLTGMGIVFSRVVLERWIWTHVPWPLEHTLVTAFSAMLMILILAWYAARAGRLTRKIRFLWGLLPICVYCHRIRNEKNEWEKLEAYITDRSKAEFTHGICPSCVIKKSSAS